MAKALSYWSFTAETRDPSQVSSCGFCSGQRGTVTGFCPSTFVYPRHHSTNAPYIIYTLLLQERLISEHCEHSKMQRFCRRSGTDGQKSTFTVLHVWNELLRRVFVGLARRRPEFDHGPLHVRFVVENVAFVQVLIWVIRQLSVPFHQCSIPIRPSQSLQKPSNWHTYH